MKLRQIILSVILLSNLATCYGSSDIKLGGLLQCDGFVVSDDNETCTDIKIRRARIIVNGTICDRLRFRIQPQWSGDKSTLVDAYFTYPVADRFSLKCGKYKSILGLEMNRSASKLLFPERGLTTCLVPSRDIGCSLFYTGKRMIQGGIMVGTGAIDQERSTGNSDNHLDLYGHLTIQRKVGLGKSDNLKIQAVIAGNYGETEHIKLSKYNLGFDQFIGLFSDGITATGSRWRINPQVTLKSHRFFLGAECVFSRLDLQSETDSMSMGNSAWLILGSFICGPWEYAGRYSELTIDKDVIQASCFESETPYHTSQYGVSITYSFMDGVQAQLSVEQNRFRDVNHHSESSEIIALRIQVCI